MRRNHVGVLFLLIGVVTVPTWVSFWVHHQIQKQLEVRVNGVFVPAFFSQTYRIREAHLEWKERIRVHAGELKVSYDLLPFVQNGRLRLKITGEHLPVTLLGKWAEIEGVEDAVIDSLFADVLIGAEGIEDLYRVDIRSPEFQFAIQAADH